MAHRSWLLVPAGNEKKLYKATNAGADVVVLDVTAGAESKPAARNGAREWLLAHRLQVTEGRRFQRWVRIDGLDTPYWRDDLLAIMPGGPDGIILSHATGPEAVQHLAAEIYENEQRNQVTAGSIKIVPQVSDTARAAMAIGAYVEVTHPRLAGLAWNGAALAGAIGADRTRTETGEWSDPCRKVRADTLITAHARGVLALEMIASPEEDVEVLAAAAKADGYSGMIAVHPSQVPAINAAFRAPVRADILAQRPALASV